MRGVTCAGQSTSPAAGSHNYVYTVVAVDKSGNQSAQSAGRSILMDTAAPTTPAAPTGATPVNVAPTITVTTTTDPGGAVASGVDHYDVYRDGSKVNVSAIPAGGPYAWNDVAGQSTSPASGSHSYAYTVVAIDAGHESVRALARAHDPDGYGRACDSGCSDRRDASECGADDHRHDDHGSGRSRGLAVSIITTSTATARRSTSPRFLRAARMYGVTWRVSRRIRRRARTATPIPCSQSTRPATSPLPRPRASS